MEEKNEHLHAIRHTLAHLLATTAKEFDPAVKLGIGPTTDTGFYYDFLFSKTPSESDLRAFEKKMRGLIARNLPMTGREITLEEGEVLFANEPFKLELLREYATEGKTLTAYTVGDFTDLCKGGHAEATGEIASDAFTLTHLAGAYWRGDEKNPMLTRIYGLAFESKTELGAHLTMMEEAKKRDHKKLGKELGLFTISPLIGAGLPLIQPKGMIIRKTIEDFLWDLHTGKHYHRVWTPHIAREELYITSGHAAKFGDELFRVSGKEEKFIMKPMNCPHHMQIFADNHFSYRDMPMRYFEPATVYRDEKSGQLGGLTRVRSITQDDGHLFCRISHIESEVSTIVSIIKSFYTTFGMMDGYWVSLSVRDDNREKYLGDDEVWQTAEVALERAAKENSLNYKRVEGEAAFYGPKLDFMFKDAIGREWQLATIQCDFNLPERFDLSFINEKGEKERPVVIHRAISGSLERFMGILIEHYAGAFPFWIAPVQIAILPVAAAHADHARSLYTALTEAGIRAEYHSEDETLGKRIRAVKTHKLPYWIVIGDKEIESGAYALEHRVKGLSEPLAHDALIARLVGEKHPNAQ